MFDPYHKWLGIPKEQRPPTLYQLLGISPTETDTEVIEEAAIRQTAHIRTYQIGPHAKECAQILAEVAQARITLLNPGRRREYDAQLAKKAAAAASAGSSQITAVPKSPRKMAAAPVFADLEDAEATKPPEPVKKRKRKRRRQDDEPALSKPMLYGIIGGGVGVLLVIVLIVALTRRGTTAPNDRDVAKGGVPKNPAAVTNENRGDQDDGRDVPPDPSDRPRAVPPAPANTVPEPLAKRDAQGKVGFPAGMFAKHFVDPDGDSTLTANDRDGALRLRVPAFHDLYPNRTMNAPRVLFEVEGDFTAEVTIDGSMIAARGLEQPDIQMSYRCGSLIVWKDENNFLRFDRGGKTTSKGQQSSYMNFLLFEDGKVRGQLMPACQDNTITLRIERRGNLLLPSWEQGGRRGDLPQRIIRWPAKVKVGAGSLNVSTQAFEAAFSGFKLVLAGSANSGKEPKIQLTQDGRKE